MSTTARAFPKAFAVGFKDLGRWDPASFQPIGWHWPKKVMAPIGSVLHPRKEKVDRALLRFSDLQPITIHFDGSVDRRIVEENREYTMDLFFAHPGDIVVAKIDLKNGAAGIIPPSWKNVVVTGHFAVYEPDRAKLVPEYFRLVIQANFFKAHLWRSKVGAEGRKEVKLDFFESLQIPLPEIKIQQRIVDVWNVARTRIDEARRCIDRLEREVPLRIYQELGTPNPTSVGPTPKHLGLRWSDLDRWSFGYLARARQGLIGFTASNYPIVPLGKHLLGTMNGYCVRPVTGPTPHRMLKLSALTPAGLDLKQSKFVKVPDRIAERFALRKGDLLICRSVGSYDLVAKCAVVERDAPDVLFPDIIICVRLSSSCLPDYVREVIQTPLGRSHFQSRARTAVGMWKIGSQDIRDFPIPLPPGHVQARIVKELGTHRAQIAREREEVKRLATAVEQEVEEMILGTRPVPGLQASRRGHA